MQQRAGALWLHLLRAVLLLVMQQAAVAGAMLQQQQQQVVASCRLAVMQAAQQGRQEGLLTQWSAPQASTARRALTASTQS
jgi:hypothetical protein